MNFSEKDFVELIELININKIDRCMFGVIGKITDLFIILNLIL